MKSKMIFLMKAAPKKSIYFLLSLPIFLVSKNGLAQKNERCYINNDSNAVYSTHPGRPFRYGPAYDYEGGLEYKNDYLKEFSFQKNEVIAEVGAASGWMLGLLSVFTDSITYYIQDIDTNYLNADQFQKVVKHYTSVRKTPQTNKFHFVIGNTTQTNLPEQTFDKVILNNTFHEITEPGLLIDDIAKKLKPGGQIIIREKFSNDIRYTYHDGCYIRAYKLSVIKKNMALRGFYLTHMSDPPGSFHNMLVFEKDKAKSDAFHQSIEPVAAHLAELDKLNNKSVSKDSVAVMKIANYLKSHLSEINKVFPSLDAYLDYLGDDYAEAKEYIQAANVYKVKTVLCPEVLDAYIEMSDCLIEIKQYDYAIRCCNIAIQKNKDFSDAYYYRAYAYQMKGLTKNGGQYLLDAYEDYLIAIDLDPKNGDILYDLSLLWEDMGDYESAVEVISDAIKLNPKDTDYLFQRTHYYHNLGQHELSVLDFNRIIELDPNSAEAYAYRAQAKKYLGDEEGYKTDKEKADALKKSNSKKPRPYKRKEMGKNFN